MTARRARPWLLAAVWLGVFAFTWWLVLARFVVVRDEAWALWVATRLARGDALYHRVYDVTTPVAAWLAAVAVKVTGPQMATMRALAAAIFATEVLLGLAVVRRAGLRPPGQVAFVLVMLAVAAPFGAFVSMYSSLAICFALATLWATSVWLDEAGPGGRVDGVATWVVGITGGLAFWTKPNVGVLVAGAVLAALVAAMWGEPAQRWVPGIVRVLAGALAVSVACLVVIAATGGFGAFVDQVFRSKGEYVELGFGYTKALKDRFHLLVSGEVPFQLRRVVELAVQVAPVVLLAALAAGAARARRATRWSRVAFLGFGVAGTLAVLPRPGLNHITGVMPLVVTAVTGAWVIGNRTDRAPAGWTRLVPVAVGGLAALGVAAIAVPLLAPPHPERFRRDAAHFAWTPVADRQLAASDRLRRELAARGIDSVFIVRKDAGFLYLRAEVDNPLPYDIVERSDLGGDDEAGVIRRLRHGQAEWVCVRKPGAGGTSDSNLIPRRLEGWIRTHLEPAGSVARCDLFRAA